MLSATGLPGNPFTPDLDLSAIPTQQVQVGQQLSLNLLTSGGTVEDFNSAGQPSGAPVRLILDPDVGTDTPLNASLTTAGVFTWTPVLSQVGTHRIVVIAIDQGTPAFADAETFIVNVLAGDDAPPVVDLNGATAGSDFQAHYLEGAGLLPIVSASDLTVSDADSANLATATVAITNRLDGAAELLSVEVGNTGIVAAYSEASGELTLVGEASVADYQQVLRTLRYSNSSQNPNETTRVIHVTVEDEDGNTSEVRTSAITIEGVNDAPQLAPIPEGAVVLGDQLEITVTATDPEGDVLTFTLDPDNAPSDATIAKTSPTTAVIRWTPSTITFPEGVGFRVLVTDDGTPQLSDAESFEVIVHAVNVSPNIAAIEDRTATVGDQMTVTVTATDANVGQTLTFFLDPENAPSNATIEKTSATTAVIRWTPIAADAPGPIAFTVLVSDDGLIPLADSEAFDVSVSAAVPAALAVQISPSDGDEHISLTRETVVNFSGEVDPATIDNASLYLIAKGARIPATIRVSPTNRFATVFYASPLPESTEVRVVVNGNAIKGVDGTPVDADGDGTVGGVGTADFRTLPLTLIPGTRLFGYVYDSYNKNTDGSDIPIVGATISLDANPAIRAVTNADGLFELGLQDLNGDSVADGLPAPEFFVHIDGSTATGAPSGTAYATMGKPFHTVPGQRVQLSMPTGPFHIYLPPMAMADIVTLPTGADANVGFGPSVTDPSRLAELFPNLSAEQRALLALTQVTYPAGSAQNADGTPATLAAVIPVNPDRLPAPLPPTASPKLVISVQAGTTDNMGNPQFNLAGGSTNFSVPAPVTFPNLDGLAPGEKSLIWSFDHDAGKWVVIGNGTVSADGKTIVSDEGVGILAPGWHFTQVGTVTPGEPCVEGEICVQVGGVQDELAGRIAYLGDVIEVDLSGTNGREFQLDSAPSMAQGKIAQFDNYLDVLRNDGKFYFVPHIVDDESRFSQAPFTVDLQFSGIGRLETDPPDAPERRLSFIVQIKNIRPGYSTSGSNSVQQLSSSLNTFRIEQRLKWLGFRGEKATENGTSPPVVVDGNLSGTVDAQAAKLFQAAIQADGRGVPSAKSGSIGPGDAAWLNASNAPTWDDTRNDPITLDSDQINGEYWATSWTRDILIDASQNALGATLRITSLTEYPDNNWPGPGGPHSRHKAGQDIDIGIGDLNGIDSGSGVIDTTLPFNLNQPTISPDERAVALRILAVTQAAGTVRIGSVFIGGDASEGEATYPRIHTILTALGVPNHTTSPGHDDHIHITLTAPSIANAAPNIAAAAISQDFESTAIGFGVDERFYYRFELSNGFELAGRSNSVGHFSEVLTPSVEYTLTVYQASTNKSAVYQGLTSASGSITDVGAIILDQFGGTDADGDGIPDVGEKAIGTNTQNKDSDNDGISDDAELIQGLDPLDDRGFPTGIISSLPLPGTATELVVEVDTAYIATGSHGLALVNIASFNNPILLGQIDLAGTAVDVDADPELGLAVVATGTGGVQIVDVSDPMAPVISVSRTNVLGEHVEVADGVAYVSVGTSLHAIDLVTGDILESINLGGSTITDIAREGSLLYTMDAGRRLRIVDVTSGAMIPRGSLVMNDGGGKLFVGNGVAYAVAANDTKGGYATANVSNPDIPTTLSPSDAPQESVPRTAIVTNGSGIGLLIGRSQRVAGDPASMQLVNVGDPSETYQLLATIALPAAPQSIAVASGIAFIAGGSAGLQIINYLPFDADGLAPSVTITTPAIDVDSATDGIQVLEGTAIPVRANVTDDVQVRSVELLVDGQVVASDVSFPFDFFTLASSLVAGATSISIQVRATDTGGNSSLSNVIAIDLVPDTFAPTISSIDPSDGAKVPQGHRTIRLLFSEPLDETVAASSNFQIVEAGPSGAFNDGDDVIVAAQIALRSDDRSVQLTTDPLPVGKYELRVDRAQIKDRAGNAMGSGLLTNAFEVVEAVPITVTFNAGLGAPLSYTEAGLTVLSRQDHVHLGDQNGDGSADLLNHSGCCSTPYQFTFENGAPFTVSSLELFAFSGSGVLTSSSGATVVLTANGEITFDPVGWTNITSFSWEQSLGQGVIDNLKLLAAPIQPGSTTQVSPSSDETLSESRASTAIMIFDAMALEHLHHEKLPAGVADPKSDAFVDWWLEQEIDAARIVMMGDAIYVIDAVKSREEIIDQILSSPANVEDLLGETIGDLAAILL